MNYIEEAGKLEHKAASHHGDEALKELQAMPQQDRLAVIKQMQNDAKQEGGQVYIDQGQLVFNSPFPHKTYEK